MTKSKKFFLICNSIFSFSMLAIAMFILVKVIIL